MSLSSSLGRRAVLYFYPKNNIPRRTREAYAFAGVYVEFKQRNVGVTGVGRGSERPHVNLAAKHELPSILLSDSELTIIQAYDVWKEKNLYGKVSTGMVRDTYVIDGNDVTEEVSEKVKPDVNTQEILDYPDGKAE